MNVIPALPQDPIDTQDELVDFREGMSLPQSVTQNFRIEGNLAGAAKSTEAVKSRTENLSVKGPEIPKPTVEMNHSRSNHEANRIEHMRITQAATVQKELKATRSNLYDAWREQSENRYLVENAGMLGAAINAFDTAEKLMHATGKQFGIHNAREAAIVFAMLGAAASDSFLGGAGVHVSEAVSKIIDVGTGVVGGGLWGKMVYPEKGWKAVVPGAIVGGAAVTGIGHFTEHMGGLARTGGRLPDDLSTPAVLKYRDQVRSGFDRVGSAIGRGVNRVYQDAKTAFNPFRGGDGGGALPVKGESITSKVGSPAFNGGL